MIEYGSKEHARWLNEAEDRQRRRRIDHSGFDFESFVDGYIECALWTDCMPDDRCKYCGEELVYDEHDPESVDSWRHVCAEPQDHKPERDEDMESSGREHLELREDARETMIEKGQLVEFVSENLSDLLAYVRGCYDGEREGFDDSQGYPESYAGHDFWLTRSGHGAGYWDRGLGELGDRLTEAAKAMGSPDDHTPYDIGDGTADV